MVKILTCLACNIIQYMLLNKNCLTYILLVIFELKWKRKKKLFTFSLNFSSFCVCFCSICNLQFPEFVLWISGRGKFYYVWDQRETNQVRLVLLVTLFICKNGERPNKAFQHVYEQLPYFTTILYCCIYWKVIEYLIICSLFHLNRYYSK